MHSTIELGAPFLTALCQAGLLSTLATFLTTLILASVAPAAHTCMASLQYVGAQVDLVPLTIHFASLEMAEMMLMIDHGHFSCNK